MSSIKRWLWELIENGDHQYLRSLGAPAWSIAEAQRYADAKNKNGTDDSIDGFDVSSPSSSPSFPNSGKPV